MLGGRLQSHAAASCSGRCHSQVYLQAAAPLPNSRRCMSVLMSPHEQHRPLSRVAAQPLHGEDAKESPFKIKPGFFEIADLNDREPNFEDQYWAESVTDWYEFWNYTRWDMEAEQLDDDLDVDGNPTRTTERGGLMWQQLADVERFPGAVSIRAREGQRNHSDNWTDPPVDPEVQIQLPDWDMNEWRAFSEKQKYKQLLDMEWRRRQSKVGKITYEHINFFERDVRMDRFEKENMRWRHEDIYALITQDGAACRPEDHKAFVENPMATVDLPNTMGVYHIEDTEDFLERIGHLGTVEPMELLEEEIILDLTSDAAPPEEALEALRPTIEALDAADAEVERKKEAMTWVKEP